MKSTYSAKMGEIKPQWYVIDAEDAVLGRLATKVASMLRGKHKPEFTPNQLCGDAIIVVNADKIRLTGNKDKQKVYYWHTGYNLKQRTYKEQMEKDSTRVIEKAIKGMLPHGPLGRAMFRRLKVYSGAEHPHGSLQPKELKMNS
jgi:large subunit ribosomal protein L13